MRRYGSGRAVLFLGAFAAASGGCQRAEFAFYPVEGTVTKGGRPLRNVEVVFLADPDSGTVGPRATGKTDAEGRYRLRTDQGDDGAVAGTHRVVLLDLECVRARPSRPTGGPLRNEVARVAPEGAKRLGDEPRAASRVPPGYGSANKTPLRAKVGPGPQTLDFDIP